MVLAVTLADVVIAAIAATPPTIAAVAAVIHARRAAGSAARVDAAVNRQAPGEDTILERVKDVQATTADIRAEQDALGANFYDLHALVVEHLKAHTSWERWVQRELDDKQDKDREV